MFKKGAKLKKIGFVLCAALVSLAIPGWQMAAFADDETTIHVRLPDVSSVDYVSAGGAGAYTATWQVNNQPITLSLHSGLEIIDTDNGKAIPFNEGVQAIVPGLYFQYDGDFCSDYVIEIAGTDGFRTTFSCDYNEPDQYGGGTSDMSIAQHINLPTDSAFFTVGVFARSQYGQPDDPQEQMFGIMFNNVDEYDEQEGHYVVVHSNDQSLAGKSFTITSQDAQIGARGDQNGTQYTVELPHDEFFTTSYAVSGDFDPETAQITLIGVDGYEYAPPMSRVGDAYVFSMGSINFPGNMIYAEVQDKHEIIPHGPDDGPEPHPGVETHSSVTVHSRATYEDPKSFYKARISINDANVFDDEECEWNSTNCAASYTRDDLRYNKEESVNTVELDIGTLFISKVVGGKVIVNEVEYDIPVDYSDRASWLEHYDHQMVGFRLIVPYAEHYDITIDVADTPGHEQVIGNFLWTNDEREKTNPNGELNDAYIGHAHLELVSVLCHITENDDEDVFFSVENGDPVPEGCVFEYEPDDGDHNYGSLVVPEGSEVTVRLKTEYGWQVTSFGSNGNEISVNPEKVAEYTFGIFRGNFHLGAVTEKVRDEVNAESEKIKGGSVKLGGSEIDEGTAMLTVSDADLSNEERERFQDEAGKYQVSTYLNIDLDQIFYDGHGSYWKGVEMKELDNEAVITLQLEDGVDGNEVVIVHQKHDGTYEIIPTVYDAKKNTIKFRTSSFSNYAIASWNNPNITTNVSTGDHIMEYVAIAICCLIGGAVAFNTIRKAKR